MCSPKEPHLAPEPYLPYPRGSVYMFLFIIHPLCTQSVGLQLLRSGTRYKRPPCWNTFPPGPVRAKHLGMWKAGREGCAQCTLGANGRGGHIRRPRFKDTGSVSPVGTACARRDDVTHPANAHLKDAEPDIGRGHDLLTMRPLQTIIHPCLKMADNMTLLSEEAEMSTTGYSSNMTNVSEPMPFGMVTAVVYSIVFIVGLLGNTLAIFVVIRYSKMKTVTNMYILNLALADELYILGIPFLGTNSVLSYWPYGDFFCKVCMTADAMSQFTSTFCLTVMSIDRYLAVIHPIRSAKWRRPQVAKIFSVMLWVMSFLVVLPVTMYSHVQEGLNTCNITWPEMQSWWSVVFILYTSILGFFGPLLVISICYLLIVIKVRSAGVRAGVTKRRKSERKVTRMVVIIVLVFVLCWMPFFITNIVNLVYIIPENSATAAVYFFLVILTYVNSCANPILYGFLSDKFKQSFQTVLCFHKTKCVANRRRGGRRAPPDHRRPILPSDGNQQNIQCVQMEAVGNPENVKTVLNGQSTQ